MTGGQNATPANQQEKAAAPAQPPGSRPAMRRPVPLAEFMIGTAAIAALTHTVAWPWLGVLIAAPLGLGAVISSLAVAVVPQESHDRLTWWREWLRHRERMATKHPDKSAPHTGSPPPTQPARSDHSPAEHHVPSGRTDMSRHDDL